MAQASSHGIQVTSQHGLTGTGIGKATALAFAKNGISALALADVNIPALDSTRHDIKTLFPHVQVETLQVNVADEAGVNSAVRKTVERFGSIEIGINCAGISGNPTPTDQMSLAEWRKVIDINQTGLWLSQRALIRQMLTQEFVISKYPRNFSLLTI